MGEQYHVLKRLRKYVEEERRKLGKLCCGVRPHQPAARKERT